MDLVNCLSRATSGRGIINLHHTLTWYAIDRISPFLSQTDLGHIMRAWIDFMGDKEEPQISFAESSSNGSDEYPVFYERFTRREAIPVVEILSAGMQSPSRLQQLGRFLVKAYCDQYQGNYDPHYLNGLGAALGVVERCWDTAPVALNALFQSLDFYFENLKTKKPGTL